MRVLIPVNLFLHPRSGLGRVTWDDTAALRFPRARTGGGDSLARRPVALLFWNTTAIARYGSEGETAKRLELAVRLEPDNPAYWYTLGRYQQYNFEQQDSALAEESYRKAIALNPDATDAWLDLATAYELDGKTEEAREAYLQAKKSYPASADVSWRYGNFLLRQGERAAVVCGITPCDRGGPHRAAAAFSRAYRSNPNIDELLAQLLAPASGCLR